MVVHERIWFGDAKTATMEVHEYGQFYIVLGVFSPVDTTERDGWNHHW
jgi:hypothetical protein